MCMIDLWVLRHTTTRMFSPGSPVSVPPNLRRVALVIADDFNVEITADTGQLLFAKYSFIYANSWTTSVTTAVPPGVDTGTMTLLNGSYIRGTTVLRVSDYGPALQGRLSVTHPLSQTRVWEVAYDTVVDQKLADLDRLEGWPMFGSPR